LDGLQSDKIYPLILTTDYQQLTQLIEHSHCVERSPL